MPEIKNQAEYHVAGSWPISGAASPASCYLPDTGPVCDTIHRNVNHLLLFIPPHGLRGGRTEAARSSQSAHLAYFSAKKATSWATRALPPGAEDNIVDGPPKTNKAKPSMEVGRSHCWDGGRYDRQRSDPKWEWNMKMLCVN
jgi:hypothetical protein